MTASGVRPAISSGRIGRPKWTRIGCGRGNVRGSGPGFERPGDGGGDDRDPRSGRQHGDPRLDLGEFAVAAPGPFGEEDDHPAGADAAERFLHARRPHPLALDRETADRADQNPSDGKKRVERADVVQRPGQRDAEDEDVEEAEVVRDEQRPARAREVLLARRAEADIAESKVLTK